MSDPYRPLSAARGRAPEPLPRRAASHGPVSIGSSRGDARRAKVRQGVAVTPEALGQRAPLKTPRSKGEAAAVALILTVSLAFMVWFQWESYVRFQTTAEATRWVMATLGLATAGASLLFAVGLVWYALPVLVGIRAPAPTD